MQVEKLKNQLAVNIGILQRTAAYVRHIANTSVANQAQLFIRVNSQQDNVTKILNTNFMRVDGDLKKSLNNQNLIYNTIESCHQKVEQ